MGYGGLELMVWGCRVEGGDDLFDKLAKLSVSAPVGLADHSQVDVVGFLVQIHQLRGRKDLFPVGNEPYFDVNGSNSRLNLKDKL